MSSVSEFDSLIHDSSIIGLCIYWHNDHLEKSQQILEWLNSSSSQFTRVMIVIVNTSKFPQLLYKHNAKMMTIQCYLKGVLQCTSSPESVPETLQSFSNQVDSQFFSAVFNIQYNTTTTQSSSHELSLDDMIESDRFGMVTVTEDMKKALMKTLQELCDECGDVPTFKQSVDVLDGVTPYL